VRDGVECQAGTSPRVASPDHRLACWGFVEDPDGDWDSDGLQNYWEVCTWGGVPWETDTDFDGAGDCQEALDVNGSSAVNQADATFVLRAVFDLADGDWIFDVNGNGQITVADGVFIQRAFFGLSPCP
jgi:hypothetical protein